MITRQSVAEHLLAYFNQEITLAELVDWAENCFAVGEFGPEQDVHLLRDVVLYLAAADRAAFPLTWEVCLGFMKQLGTPVRVVLVDL
jgi:hypothetical protein